MESSHITGDDGEGCNSSESGWTMYLASPMQSGDDDDGGSRKGSGSDGSNVDDGYGYTYLVRGRKGGKEYYQDDGDDNDSLASDASTGPAKVKVQPPSPDAGHRKNGDNDGGGGGERPKEEDEEEDDMRTRFSTSSRKKAGNKAEKGGEGKSSKKKGSSSRTSFFW
ncbi:uncharacterized protein [Aegilops tauschii subsp. strangulata]|nr:protein SOB FIVE-LIKE 4 [Aegilops tauschii subsp. strangulata]XP_044416686.1 protein SOB FIVE-LIKE 4-like [Triticum aestivum]